MPLSTFSLAVTGFRFPRSLPAKRSNFRFVADVRYVSGRGDFDTAHAVLPDLDRYWECDADRRDSPLYVRGPDAGEFGTFDMTRIDDWDRLVLLVRGDALHSLQLKVFDVDRPDFMDRASGAVGDVVSAVLGRRDEAIAVAPVLEGAFGRASDDVESALLARLAGGERLLFRGSTSFDGPGDYVVSGLGEAGEYAIRCELSIRD